MDKRICDVCNKREASRSYKIKQSLKGYWQLFRGGGGMWNSSLWQPYKEIDICGECAEKLLGLSYRDSHGLSRLPHSPKK